MGNIGTWQLIIVLAIVFLLFGAKRLPEAARGLGRSLKIFKTETQGLINKDDKADDVTGEGAPQAQQQAPRAVEQQAAPQQQPAQQADDQPRRDA
ncbi:Sec-independent protein translocase subunit TatA [Jiangella rhizosphaerae]|uniref:Sec-independent protein translocase protein TatA n=1 Tax=Jiangella rhizosphaerae TaxID=2293569 RepID=A0A418KLU9_9ACTN|nr:Sec-independent protein translocase subunit TatA [Jiangella rhizosphaerae]RIQ18909.1 Sec-independent protein translocase subunit TatA [Jiangella rhizosphaerae]